MAAIPRGIWAVASDLVSPQQAAAWCRSAAGAAAFSMRRCKGEDPQLLATMRALLEQNHFLASHGRADLAQLGGANAVIAGVRSLSVATYRQHFPSLMVGASTHSLDEARLAIDAGATFLFYGPVWDTPEKSGILAPRGIHNLAQVVALGAPVIAIGGITQAQQLTELQSCGVFGAAVLRAARDQKQLQVLVDAWHQVG